MKHEARRQALSRRQPATALRDTGAP